MMGFSFIGVLMDDLITAAATIHAAQIQANYTLWAASISSVVGAAGIIFAAWYAWQSGIKLHQHNNIIEAKREVYLDAIVKYQQFINDFRLLVLVPDRFHEIFLNNKKEFLISINKVQLICDTSNKNVVIDLKDGLEDQIKELFEAVEIFTKSHYSLIESKAKASLAQKEQDEFFKNNPEYVQGKVFQSNIHLRGLKLAEEKNTSSDRLIIVQYEYDYNLQYINEKIEKFESELSMKYSKFSSVLRAELKIEN